VDGVVDQIAFDPGAAHGRIHRAGPDRRHPVTGVFAIVALGLAMATFRKRLG
jgi:hypothetical protein